jgi:formate C-acetyltransferase
MPLHAAFPPQRWASKCSFSEARCNIAKTFLLSLNGGVDEVSGIQVAPDMGRAEDGVLEYNSVIERFKNTANGFVPCMSIP